MSAVGRFTFIPTSQLPCDETAIVQHVLYTEGTEPTEDNFCTFELCPGVEYNVDFEVLRNDLAGEEEHVVKVTLDDYTFMGPSAGP